MKSISNSKLTRFKEKLSDTTIRGTESELHELLGPNEKDYILQNLRKIKIKEMSNMSYSGTEDSECSLIQQLRHQGHKVQTRDRLSNTLSLIQDNKGHANYSSSNNIWDN